MNYSEIVKNAHPLIVSSLNKYARGKGEFEDLYQDGVLHIMQELPKFDGDRGITVFAYLKTVLRYFYLNYGRYEKKAISLNTELPEEGELIDLMEDKSASTEEWVLKEEEARELLWAMSKLNGEEKDLIIKIFVKSQTLDSIAYETGTSRTTIHRRKTEIIKKLKKTMEKAKM